MTPLPVFAAGSLRHALPAMADAVGLELEIVFGPSGLLRERIERGERPRLFLPANLAHGQSLARQGLCAAPVAFAQNSLCLFGKRSALAGRSVLEAMLTPENRLGTSTPKADPGGDYAFSVFERAESVLPGSGLALRSKALTLVGGNDTPKGTGGRSPVLELFAADKVDIFLGYRTTALDVTSQGPDLEFLELPEELAVCARYGAVALTLPEGDDALKALQTPAAATALEACGFTKP